MNTALDFKDKDNKNVDLNSQQNKEQQNHHNIRCTSKDKNILVCERTQAPNNRCSNYQFASNNKNINNFTYKRKNNVLNNSFDQQNMKHDHKKNVGKSNSSDTQRTKSVLQQTVHKQDEQQQESLKFTRNNSINNNKSIKDIYQPKLKFIIQDFSKIEINFRETIKLTKFLNRISQQIQTSHRTQTEIINLWKKILRLVDSAYQQFEDQEISLQTRETRYQLLFQLLNFFDQAIYKINKKEIMIKTMIMQVELEIILYLTQSPSYRATANIIQSYQFHPVLIQGDIGSGKSTVIPLILLSLAIKEKKQQIFIISRLDISLNAIKYSLQEQLKQIKNLNVLRCDDEKLFLACCQQKDNYQIVIFEENFFARLFCKYKKEDKQLQIILDNCGFIYLDDIHEMTPLTQVIIDNLLLQNMNLKNIEFGQIPKLVMSTHYSKVHDLFKTHFYKLVNINYYNQNSLNETSFKYNQCKSNYQFISDQIQIAMNDKQFKGDIVIYVWNTQVLCFIESYLNQNKEKICKQFQVIAVLQNENNIQQLFKQNDVIKVFITCLSANVISYKNIGLVIDLGEIQVEHFHHELRCNLNKKMYISEEEQKQRRKLAGISGFGTYMSIYKTTQTLKKDEKKSTDPSIGILLILQNESEQSYNNISNCFQKVTSEKYIQYGLDYLLEITAVKMNPKSKLYKITSLGLLLLQLPYEPAQGLLFLEAHFLNCFDEVAQAYYISREIQQLQYIMAINQANCILELYKKMKQLKGLGFLNYIQMYKELEKAQTSLQRLKNSRAAQRIINIFEDLKKKCEDSRKNLENLNQRLTQNQQYLIGYQQQYQDSRKNDEYYNFSKEQKIQMAYFSGNRLSLKLLNEGVFKFELNTLSFQENIYLDQNRVDKQMQSCYICYDRVTIEKFDTSQTCHSSYSNVFMDQLLFFQNKVREQSQLPLIAINYSSFQRNINSFDQLEQNVETEQITNKQQIATIVSNQGYYYIFEIYGQEEILINYFNSVLFLKLLEKLSKAQPKLMNTFSNGYQNNTVMFSVELQRNKKNLMILKCINSNSNIINGEIIQQEFEKFEKNLKGVFVERIKKTIMYSVIQKNGLIVSEILMPSQFIKVNIENLPQTTQKEEVFEMVQLLNSALNKGQQQYWFEILKSDSERKYFIIQFNTSLNAETFFKFTQNKATNYNVDWNSGLLASAKFQVNKESFYLIKANQMQQQCIIQAQWSIVPSLGTAKIYFSNYADASATWSRLQETTELQLDMYEEFPNNNKQAVTVIELSKLDYLTDEVDIQASIINNFQGFDYVQIDRKVFKYSNICNEEVFMSQLTDLIQQSTVFSYQQDQSRTSALKNRFDNKPETNRNQFRSRELNMSLDRNRRPQILSTSKEKPVRFGSKENKKQSNISMNSQSDYCIFIKIKQGKCFAKISLKSQQKGLNLIDRLNGQILGESRLRMKMIQERSIVIMKQVYVIFQDQISCLKNDSIGIKIKIPKIENIIYDSQQVAIRLTQEVEGKVEQLNDIFGALKKIVDYEIIVVCCTPRDLEKIAEQSSIKWKQLQTKYECIFVQTDFRKAQLKFWVKNLQNKEQIKQKVTKFIYKQILTKIQVQKQLYEVELNSFLRNSKYEIQEENETITVTLPIYKISELKELINQKRKQSDFILEERCPICICCTIDLIQPYTCKCKFCKDCTIKYIKIKAWEISSYQIIGCPDHPMSTIDIQQFEAYPEYQLITEIIQLRIQRALDDQLFKEGQPKYIRCCSIGCNEAFLRYYKEENMIQNNNIYNPNNVKCEGCFVEFCLLCSGNSILPMHEQIHPSHVGRTCKKYFEERVEEFDNIKDLALLTCPNCKIVVTKGDGCNHMFCKCGIHFCSICLKQFKNPKDVYTHLHQQHQGIYN